MHSYCDIRLQVIVYSVAANIPEIPDFSHKLFGAYCDSYNVSEFFFTRFDPISRQSRALSREYIPLLHGNNKYVDQPAHPCNLINAFILRLLKC